MKRNYLASRLDSIQQSFPLPGREKRNRKGTSYSYLDERKKRKDLNLLYLPSTSCSFFTKIRGIAPELLIVLLFPTYHLVPLFTTDLVNIQLSNTLPYYSPN